MLRKFSLLFILSFALLPSLFADSWAVGFNAGYVLNGVKASSGYREETSYDVFHGYGVSIPIQYYFTDDLGLETGLRLTERSYRYVHSFDGETILDIHEHNAYLEIPIMMIKSWNVNRFSFSFGLGGYLGLLVYKTEGGSFLTLSFNQDLDFITERYYTWKDIDTSDNLFEAGLSVKLSSTFEIVEDIDIFFETRGDFSFTPIEREYQENQSFRYNLSAVFSLGVLYSFGGNQ